MAYVIMRGGSSPVAIIIPTPVAVRATRNQVCELTAKPKQEAAISNWRN